MTRWLIGLAIGIALSSLGCQSGPGTGAPTVPPPANEKEPEAIVAVSPAPTAEGVLLTPQFKWKVPPGLGMPKNISFTLLDVGPGDKPPPPAAEGKQIAYCSGLHDTSPNALDPFHPPAGSILTGEIRSMKELKADTWYRWTVRAIGDDATGTETFLFKTRP